MKDNPYKKLPSVDKVLEDQLVSGLLQEFSREFIVRVVRDQIELARSRIARGSSVPTISDIAAGVSLNCNSIRKPWPEIVINATGVVLHTNLGRAPLSLETIQALSSASSYADLELDLSDGKRGLRNRSIATLLRELTGSEDSIVLNNNAGAMLLGISAIGSGREVIVARGEASEIGGGFRIPDVLLQSGARLVEVGTVNRTYANDYAEAITSDTAAILIVHRSNFKVVGFTHQPTIQEIAEVAQDKSIPLLHDLGSGALLETTEYGLLHEWTPQESIEAGADLVFISGDKLLGGPQAGLVLGKSELITKLSNHPLARALRADKLTFTALNATLLHYIKNEATSKIPVWQMISQTSEEIKKRATKVAKAIHAQSTVMSGESTVGGGSLPGDTLPTQLLCFDHAALEMTADGFAKALRLSKHPVLARIDNEQVVLDLRTVLPQQDNLLIDSINRAINS